MSLSNALRQLGVLYAVWNPIEAIQIKAIKNLIINGMIVTDGTHIAASQEPPVEAVQDGSISR